MLPCILQNHLCGALWVEILPGPQPSIKKEPSPFQTQGWPEVPLGWYPLFHGDWLVGPGWTADPCPSSQAGNGPCRGLNLDRLHVGLVTLSQKTGRKTHRYTWRHGGKYAHLPRQSIRGREAEDARRQRWGQRRRPGAKLAETLRRPGAEALSVQLHPVPRPARLALRCSDRILYLARESTLSFPQLL